VLKFLPSNSQYAKTGAAFGEKAMWVKLLTIANEALDNLSSW
jgi:hypothetical protein